MRGVVNRETQSDNQEDNDDTVHGEIPVVDESEYKDVDEDDGEDHEKGDGQTASDEHDNDEDGDKGEGNTRKSLLQENRILLIIEKFFRRGVGVIETILVMNRFDII